MIFPQKIFIYIILAFFTNCTPANEKQPDAFLDTSVQVSAKKSLSVADTTANEAAKDSVQYLFPVEGNYTLEQHDVNCKMNLTIYRNNGQFYYRLKTGKQQWKGDVVITPNEKQDGYYITLKDIEWSEYEGTINFDEEDIEEQDDIALPQEVQGVLYENEITIQNTGNAMNYYVKFGDCDLKYIRLVKNGKEI